MAVATLLIAMVLGAASNEQVLDTFDYPDAAAARQAWRTSAGTPELGVVSVEGRTVLELPAPFTAQSDLPRSILDRVVQLNLSAAGEFALELSCDEPKAATLVSLYFHSGNGWYAAARDLSKPGWQTYVFSKSSFRREEQPGGWDKIDRIRIAVWRGQAKDTRDTTIRLRRLVTRWQELALVVPAGDTASTTGEIRTALNTAEQVGGMLTELGLGFDTLDEAAVAQGGLGQRRLAVLAYNPELGGDTVKALVQFVNAGGRVFVCYRMPEPLAKALGFQPGKYLRQERAGQFAEMRREAALAGMPDSVPQDSGNITVAAPAGENARVVAQWCDAEGKSTGQPALLVSDRGAYLTHIFLPGQHEAKTQLLAAVLGHLEPGLWETMARHQLETLHQTGHLDSLAELKQFVAEQNRPQATEQLAAAEQAIQAAESALAAQQAPEAIQKAKAARESLTAAYLLGQPSPTREGRAWWNHSGTGAYPGDWDRTCRELAANGFNMILPNMLWAGVAHYPSEVLPQSDTFKKHGDQIAQCLAAAKRYGLETHVWKVNYNLLNAPAEFVDKLRAEGRTQVSVSGGSKNWLCPSHPENFRLELESLLEVVRKYEVDGIHFDYIRYPDRRHCFCDGCRERFQKDTGVQVEHWPQDCFSGPLKAQYQDWRCQQITRLVEAVSREAKKIRPTVKISAAVFGTYPNCREMVGQDWPVWAKAGYVDFLCPMDYTNSDEVFVKLVREQLELVEGRVPLYPGIGCTASNSRLASDRVVGQIHYARTLGAGGFTIFNLAPDTMQSVVPAVGQGAGSQKAVPPSTPQ